MKSNPKPLPNDYDPVPKEIRPAWDEVMKAGHDGQGLTSERAKQLNEMFLEELKKTHSPEEIDEMMREADSMLETASESQTEAPVFFQGHCPQCVLAGLANSDMLLNHDDFWECSACHLQAHTVSTGMFALLRQRGQGDFRATKENAASHASGWVLTKSQKADLLRADSAGFNGTAELQRFLDDEVS